MIGARIGARIGTVFGARIGVGVDELGPGVDPMAGVTRDATSGIYIPQTAGEWTTTLTAAGIASGGPAALWKFQDASGNPADSIGSFTLTATGTPSYQQAVAGWTSLSITFPDGATGALTTTAAGLPDISTTSILVLVYVRMPATAPAGTRNVVTVGTVAATRTAAEILNTPTLRAFTNANTAVGSNPVGAVRPVVVQVNRTGSITAVYTDQDKLLPTFSAGTTGKAVVFGGSSNASAAQGYVYATMFSGAAADLSAGQVKTLLQILGWAIPWP